MADDYDYVMHGKCYKVEDASGPGANWYVFFCSFSYVEICWDLVEIPTKANIIEFMFKIATYMCRTVDY